MRFTVIRHFHWERHSKICLLRNNLSETVKTTCNVHVKTIRRTRAWVQIRDSSNWSSAIGYANHIARYLLGNNIRYLHSLDCLSHDRQGQTVLAISRFLAISQMPWISLWSDVQPSGSCTPLVVDSLDASPLFPRSCVLRVARTHARIVCRSVV